MPGPGFELLGRSSPRIATIGASQLTEPFMDLVIRNASLPDGRRHIDIAIEGARIAAVGERLPVSGAREIDAAGDLVTPPFVDAHFHMDATLSYGLPRVNASGTL